MTNDQEKICNRTHPVGQYPDNRADWRRVEVMATGQLGAVFRQINRLFGSGTVSGLTEAQLLGRFIERRDEAAFEALVSRFGPMVLGVCRQMLSDPHAADDAFQATFLVLVKRARSIRDRDLLGNWLYGVALKVAKRSRADRAKRRNREQEGAAVMSEPIGESPSFEDLDLGPILHEELARLPEKYRAPMVLCFLDGQTCEEAAERLGWPVGTVKGRVSRAKDLLRERLSRRGVTTSTVLLAATLTKTARAAVSPLLLDQTVKAAMGLAAGGAIAAAGLGSATAVALAEGVSTTMILTKAKLLVMMVGLFATVAGSAAVVARQGGLAAPGQDTKQASTKVGAIEPAKAETNRDPAISPEVYITTKSTDALDKTIAGYPLPADADENLAALRVKLAKETLNVHMAFYENGTITIDRLLESAKAYLDARMEAAGDDETAKLKAIEDQVRLTGAFLQREKSKYEVGQGALPNVTEADRNYTESRILLAKARAGQGKVGGSTKGKIGTMVPGTSPLPNRADPNSGIAAKNEATGIPGAESDDPVGDKIIRAALEKPLAMAFASETPLEDVIKYIRSATQEPGMDQGLPIYLDPTGLQETDKTASSPVTLSLEGIKLKTTLRLMLKQIGLGYYVKHGLLIITNLDDEDYKDAIQPDWRAREAAATRANMGGGGMGGGGMGGGMGGQGGGGGGLR
jgi:RNA polymerase sigma factor (sigma-70 family)